MAIGNKRHVLRQAAMLVAFGYIAGVKHADCPICGNEIGKAFTTTFNGFSDTVSDAISVACDVAHIQAESKGGTFEVDNTFPAHKICNLIMTSLSFDYFCERWQTAMSANQIRQTASMAQEMADNAISGKVVYPQVSKVALELIAKSSDYKTRVPASLVAKLQATA